MCSWGIEENDMKERECHEQRCQDGKHDGLFVGDGKCFVSPELKVQTMIESNREVLVSWFLEFLTSGACILHLISAKHFHAYTSAGHHKQYAISELYCKPCSVILPSPLLPVYLLKCFEPSNSSTS